MSVLINEDFYFGEDPYFNPQLVLDSLEKKHKVEQLVNGFHLNKSQIANLRQSINTELQYGLQSNPPRPSAFPMYNTFVTNSEFPTGKEVGDFLGMDIGGTNLRLIHLKLNKVDDDKYEKNIQMHFYDVPDRIRKSNSEMFFGFLASKVEDFFIKENLKSLGKSVPLGFSFSFGYRQFGINRGSIEMFGINTNIPDAIGKCPVELLQTSLDKLHVPVKVVALANDCTATLIYAKYLDPATRVSLIQGSGTNVCYIEKMENCGTIESSEKTFGSPKVDRFIINTEYCVYGDKGELDSLRTKYDFACDANSFLPGVYVYEKVMGGAFLGDLCRIVLIDLIQTGLLLDGGLVTEQLGTKGGITSADLSAIELEAGANYNNDARRLDAVVHLFTRLGYLEELISEDDCAIVVFVTQLITTRAAVFTSAAVSVFVDHLKDEPVVKVGCDGSLFRKHPKMSKLVNSFVNAFCPGRKVQVFDADQGSGIGVAMIAATVLCNGTSA